MDKDNEHLRLIKQAKRLTDEVGHWKAKHHQDTCRLGEMLESTRKYNKHLTKKIKEIGQENESLKRSLQAAIGETSLKRKMQQIRAAKT